MEIAVLNLWSLNNNKCTQPKIETTMSENYYRTKAVLVILIQYCNQQMIKVKL